MSVRGSTKTRDAIYEKYGRDFYRNISRRRKNPGRKASPYSLASLGKKRGVSRQMVSMIIRSHGHLVDKENFVEEGFWREAVLDKYFNNN